MSRRKQTNPRAIKRDGKIFILILSVFYIIFFLLLFLASQDDDDTLPSVVKSNSQIVNLISRNFLLFLFL